MLKSILKPYNNFKFNEAESSGKPRKIAFALKRQTDPKVSETFSFPIGGNGLSLQAEAISDLSNNIEEINRRPSEEAQASDIDFKENISYSVSSLKNEKAEIENEINQIIVENLEAVMSENQMNEAETILLITEQIHEQNPAIQINLNNINEIIASMSKALESEDFLKDENDKISLRLQSDLSKLRSDYDGSEAATHDKKVRLDRFIENRLYDNGFFLQDVEIQEVFELYGEKAEEKFENWKRKYISKNKSKIISTENTDIEKKLRTDFTFAIKRYPLLKDSLQSIILKNQTPENIADNKFGLSDSCYTKFIVKINTDLEGALYYLEENSSPDKTCLYNLDDLDKVYVGEICEQNIEFRIAMVKQAEENSQEQIQESQATLQIQWNNNNQNRIDKIKEEEKSQAV
jgi:hypothetical protein